jgi:hypothetical protein
LPRATKVELLRRSGISSRGTNPSARSVMASCWRRDPRSVRASSSVRQEDHSSHQADGAYHLEADPSLSRRLLSDLSDHRRGRGSVGAGATRRLHHRPATSAPRFGGAAWRGIHGTRRRVLICTVAGRRNRFAAEFATMIG